MVFIFVIRYAISDDKLTVEKLLPAFTNNKTNKSYQRPTGENYLLPLNDVQS